MVTLQKQTLQKQTLTKSLTPKASVKIKSTSQQELSEVDIIKEAQRLDSLFKTTDFASINNFKTEYNNLPLSIRQRMSVSPEFIEAKQQSIIKNIELEIARAKKKESLFGDKSRIQPSILLKEKYVAKAYQQDAIQKAYKELLSRLKKGEILKSSEIKNYARERGKIARAEGSGLLVEASRKTTASNLVKQREAMQITAQTEYDKALNVFSAGKELTSTQRKKVYMDLIKLGLTGDAIGNLVSAYETSPTQLNKIKDEEFGKVWSKLSSKKGGSITLDRVNSENIFKSSVNQELKTSGLQTVSLSKNISIFEKEYNSLLTRREEMRKSLTKDVTEKTFNDIVKNNYTLENKALTGQTMTPSEIKLWQKQIELQGKNLTKKQLNIGVKLLSSPINYGKYLKIRYDKGEKNPLFNDFKNIGKGALKEIGDSINFITGVKGLTINSKGESFDGIIAKGARAFFNYETRVIKELTKGKSVKAVIGDDLKKITSKSKEIKNKTVDVIKVIKQNPIGVLILVSAGLESGIIKSKADFFKNPEENIGRAIVWLFPGKIIKGVAKGGEISLKSIDKLSKGVSKLPKVKLDKFKKIISNSKVPLNKRKLDIWAKFNNEKSLVQIMGIITKEQFIKLPKVKILDIIKTTVERVKVPKSTPKVSKLLLIEEIKKSGVLSQKSLNTLSDLPLSKLKSIYKNVNKSNKDLYKATFNAYLSFKKDLLINKLKGFGLRNIDLIKKKKTELLNLLISLLLEKDKKKIAKILKKAKVTTTKITKGKLKGKVIKETTITIQKGSLKRRATLKAQELKDDLIWLAKVKKTKLKNFQNLSQKEILNYIDILLKRYNTLKRTNYKQLLGVKTELLINKLKRIAYLTKAQINNLKTLSKKRLIELYININKKRLQNYKSKILKKAKVTTTKITKGKLKGKVIKETTITIQKGSLKRRATLKAQELKDDLIWLAKVKKTKLKNFQNLSQKEILNYIDILLKRYNTLKRTNYKQLLGVKTELLINKLKRIAYLTKAQINNLKTLSKKRLIELYININKKRLQNYKSKILKKAKVTTTKITKGKLKGKVIKETTIKVKEGFDISKPITSKRASSLAKRMGKGGRVRAPLMVHKQARPIITQADKIMDDALKLKKGDRVRFKIGKVKDKTLVRFTIGKEINNLSIMRNKIKTLINNIKILMKYKIVNPIKIQTSYNRLLKLYLKSSLVVGYLRKINNKDLNFKTQIPKRLLDKIKLDKGLTNEISKITNIKVKDLEKEKDIIKQRINLSIREVIKTPIKTTKTISRLKTTKKTIDERKIKSLIIPKVDFDNKTFSNRVLEYKATYRERNNKLKPFNSKTNKIVTKTIIKQTTKNRMLKIVADKVDNSLVRSMEVKVMRMTNKKIKDIPKPKVLNKFRLKKSKNTPVLKLVELAKSTYDTVGEKRETKIKRLQKSKKVTKKKSKITKSKKKVSSKTKSKVSKIKKLKKSPKTKSKKVINKKLKKIVKKKKK